MSPSSPDLPSLCAELAEELEDVTSSSDGQAMTFARAGKPFARIRVGTLELRLPDDIADAATRTPDTTALEEPGWIRLAPESDEPHVTDRAEAWFHTAWRHAGSR